MEQKKIFDDFESQEYFIRRYTKVIRDWTNIVGHKDSITMAPRIILRILKLIGTDKETLTDIYNFLDHAPTNISFDAFSNGQITSKQWIIDELHNLDIQDIGNLLYLCSWVGLGPLLLYNSSIQVNKCLGLDIDGEASYLANMLNAKNSHTFQSITMDITEAPYNKIKEDLRFDTVINTSCEHLFTKDWINNVDDGTLLILQSNNYFDHLQHVNCHKSLDDFVDNVKLSKILYKGELPHEKYTRFMIIGLK